MFEIIAWSPCAPPSGMDTEIRRRSRRVVILLMGLAALGLGDLYATVTHATSLGMFELNPIGAYLIDGGSIFGLIAFKLATMAVAIGALLMLRSHVAGECTTWLLVGVMVALTLHWYRYNMELTAHMGTVNYHALSQQIKLTLAGAHGS